MATRTTEITTEQRLTIVKHLASRHSVTWVATTTRLPEEVVREIGNEHGGVHNPPALEKAAKVLQTNLAREAQAGITERPDLARAIQPERKQASRPLAPPTSGVAHTQPVRVSGGTQGSETNGKSPTFDATAALLLRGRESTKKRTQRLAEKVSEELTQLRDALDNEDQERRQAEQLEKEKAEARAEVERLQQELREAQERARQHNKGYAAKRRRANAIRDGQPRTGSSKQPTEASLIRRWAAERGMDCPAFGRVPGHVMDAYAAAEGSPGS